MSFQKTLFKVVKSTIDLEIYFTVLYFKKLILNSPYNDQKSTFKLFDGNCIGFSSNNLLLLLLEELPFRVWEVV